MTEAQEVRARAKALRERRVRAPCGWSWPG